MAPERPPPLPKTKDGANTSVKSSTATWRKDARPIEEHMIRQMFLAHSFDVSQDLRLTPGSTASHAAGTSIHSAGTSCPETWARVLFRHHAQEQVLGVADVVVRDGIDYGTRPDLMEGIVAGRSAPDTAFVELDVGGEDLPRGSSASKRLHLPSPYMARCSLFRRIANAA